MDIRIVPFEELDKNKWSSCVHYAPHGSVYGYWWYLRNTIKEWDGIIEGDYQTVFPLVSPKLLELKSSELIRELGIYSVNIMSIARVKAVLNAIPDKYQQFGFYLNPGVNPPLIDGLKLSPHEEHQLLMNKPYEELASFYTPEVKKKLAFATSHKIMLTTNIKPEKVADLYLENSKAVDREKNFHAYQRIMYNAMHRGIGFASAVIDEFQNILAAGFFIFSHGKVQTLLANATVKGYDIGAYELLFDMVIRTNAGKPAILDFDEKRKDARAVGAHFGAMPVTSWYVSK